MKHIISKTSCRFFSFFILSFILSVFSNAFVQAQTAQPELSVSGFRLGAEAENAKRLQSFSPRYDDETGQPKYLFYNEFGTQILSLTAISKERPFLLVKIEVFAVGKSYQQKHYQLKDTSFFVTESGFFIGERPSATSMLFAVANVTGAKDVIGKKDAPQSDEKNGKARTIFYRLNADGKSVAGEAQFKETALGSVDASAEFYKAEYHFVKNRLRRFSFSIDAASLKAPKF